MLPIWIAYFVVFLMFVRTTVWRWRLRLASETATVTGRVIRVQRRFAPDGPYTTGTIQYSTPLGKYTIKAHFRADLRAGQKYEVCYLPASPKVANVSNSDSLVFNTVAVIVVTGILAVIVYAVAMSR
ncbi:MULTISPECIES: DUF3592 domain-containing protein [Micromonospora]|nr:MULTISPECIES: DUF3592 domain-containing protein [Micromonospora]NES14915.1 DUF3592 domain-containing protein [Micromonospora sp. PPF5-17B]NES35162.1 DUF3592 domain-containing protein [Micromonospora solifontis]NES55157.1 DUF3592 domain-containing protein [Micromonospora sp. PPF5-6]